MTHVINILYKGMGFKFKLGASLSATTHTIVVTILALSLWSLNVSNHINKDPSSWPRKQEWNVLLLKRDCKYLQTSCHWISSSLVDKLVFSSEGVDSRK